MNDNIIENVKFAFIKNDIKLNNIKINNDVKRIRGK